MRLHEVGNLSLDEGAIGALLNRDHFDYFSACHAPWTVSNCTFAALYSLVTTISSSEARALCCSARAGQCAAVDAPSDLPEPSRRPPKSSLFGAPSVQSLSPRVPAYQLDLKYREAIFAVRMSDTRLGRCLAWYGVTAYRVPDVRSVRVIFPKFRQIFLCLSDFVLVCLLLLEQSVRKR